MDHRRRALRGSEVLCKAVGVDRGRGHDDLQVGPTRQDLFQVAEQKIDVQRPLMRLVDDQRVVGAQQRVALRLGQQDAVGHQLDRRAGLKAVLEAHLEADHRAQRRLQLFGDALGHARRGDASRLGMTDQSAGVGAPAAEGEGDLGQLRRLARAGLAADDDHRMRPDRLRNLVTPRRNRQRLGEGDLGERVRNDVGGHGARLSRAMSRHAPDAAMACGTIRAP